METIILGGDARMAALASMMRGARYVSDAAAARALLPTAQRVVTNCPPKMDITIEEVLRLARADARVFLCGPKFHGSDDRIVDLWANEALLIENARLTAEGALVSAMSAGRRSIRNLHCLVIGGGRIGRALMEMLNALGADATLASRSESHRRHFGAKAISLENLPDILPEARLIFSTPPVMALDAEKLKFVHRDAMIVDLASPPYGVDLNAAWALGLRAWREPGLPGRYCPESAARAILNAIERSDCRD